MESQPAALDEAGWAPDFKIAVDAVRQLRGRYQRGEITIDRWAEGVADVMRCLDSGAFARALQEAYRPAAAPPRPPDTPEPVAAQLGVTRASSYPVHPHVVQGHDA